MTRHRRRSGSRSSASDNEDEAEIPIDREDDSSSDSELEISFECHRPQPSDAQGIRLLLNGYLDKTAFPAGQLAMQVAEQEFVGSVVKVTDEEDVLGFLSCVNLGLFRSSEAGAAFASFLLSKCPANLHSFFDDLINSNVANKTGLIIHERFFNIPPELGVPLWERMNEELTWAVEDGVLEFDFDRFIYLSCVYTPKIDSVKVKGKKNKKKVAIPQFDCTPIYLKYEDEFFQKHSLHSFKFPSELGADKASMFDFDVKAERLVLVLTREGISNALKEAKKLVNDPREFELYDRSS
ncbi:hypothetical protein GEMRC1_001646 [Eukaryota sp. GEM-RC1]